ncbi:MAG: hypothetical protein PF495_09990 [Spirochaetales bacterium]|jgi:hypothetical protein|nr:hypothetical protein [Spirochaetales bacterium]
MKKTLAITTVTLLITCFSTMNAYADNKTMEGVFIVAGVKKPTPKTLCPRDRLFGIVCSFRSSVGGISL